MFAIRERVRILAEKFPAVLARFGIVDRRMGEEAFVLASPVMVTGGLRVFLRLADFLMVGVALGDAALAALELGFQFFFIGFGLSLAISSGTISVVSRYKGGGQHDEADFAMKQSLWLALLISLPLTMVSWLYAEPLIDLLTDDPRTIALGASYLRIVMLSLAFRFWSMIASRALAGSGDTLTPMYVRSLTLPTNVVLNAVLIFGLLGFPALGIVGAAIGTAVTNGLIGVIFLALTLSGRYEVVLRMRGKQWDTAVAWEILRVGAPLGGMRILQTIGRFPFLFVLGVFGTPVLAAYSVARRVILIAMMPAWGYSTAASTLVGQSLGAGDREEAAAYGWQTLRIGLATQLVIAAILLVGARPIAVAFNPSDAALAADFIRVFAVGVAGFSIDRTMRGGLRGAGDTRWPLYGAIVGIFLLRIPVAFAALPPGFVVSIPPFTVTPGLGLGISGVFVAILADLYAKGAVNLARFASGRWKQIAGETDVGGAPTEE